MLERVKGQTDGITYLRQIIERRLESPLLLLGPSGVGRRTSVLEAARELVQGDESQLYQIDRGIHPDVSVISPEDGKELKVDSVRALLEKSKFNPSRAPLRFLVIDGIDHASTAASTALLKTLEEVPSGTRFFLLAESSASVLPTILSRCTVVRYRPLPETFVVECLRSHTDSDVRSLVCSRLAEGSVGRAIQYLNSGKLALRDDMLGVLSLSARKDVRALFAAVDAAEGDLSLAIHFLEFLLHDLTVVPIMPTRIVNVDRVDSLLNLREKLGPPKVDALMQGLRTLQSRRQQAPINLSFHVKTLLATTL